MLQNLLSLRQSWLTEYSFLYIVLGLTYIRGLILELSRNYPISAADQLWHRLFSVPLSRTKLSHFIVWATGNDA